MNRPLHVTRHAIDRFRDRVDRSATRAEAVIAVRQIGRSASICSQPRKWRRLAGVRTVNAVVTVFSKEASAEWRIPTIGVAA